jgi:hypothetical protein
MTCAGSEQATYTTDGSTPNIASTLYSTPLTFSSVGTTTLEAVGSVLVAHNANTQTSLGNIGGTGIGYKCNTQNTQTYGSLTCTAAGGVTGQPTNVTLTAGSTMNYTQTSSGSAQSLIPYFGTATGGSIDTCTYFAQDKYIEAIGTTIANNEVDGQIYNNTYGISHTMGWQANQSGTNSGKWQIDANGGTGWVTTDCTTAIPISTSAYTHIAITGHWINGDTGCTGNGCFYYDHQTVNGTDCDLSYLGGQPQGTTSDRSLMANQDQLDSTSAGGTIGRNIQNNTVACSVGPPSTVTTGVYTITAGGAATPILEPNNYVTGNNALAAPSPVLAFGKQGTSTSSPAIPISISNPSNAAYCTTLGIGCGTGSVTVTSMTITGTNAGDFTLAGTCTTIASGSDCEPTITFKPTAAANTAETATLTVNMTGATTSSQTMGLTGTSATTTALSTTSNPTALSGSTNYQVAAPITAAGTNFTIGSSGTDVNLDGQTITYGNTSTASQVNQFAASNYNAGITLHNGTFTYGAGTNTKGAGHPQSSGFGYTSSFNMASGITVFNTTFNYNIQFANAVEDNNGFLVFHDNQVNDSAVGTCASIACRNQLFGTPIYQENVSTRPSGSSQYYNNYLNGGPQGGLDGAAPGTIISYNTINPGNVSGNNTNDFAIYAWGQADQVYDNVICTPLAANCNTRGIQISAAQSPGETGVDVYNNIVGAYETPTNSEYGGCQVGGAYGLQFDDNPVGPNTAYSNYVVAYAKACSGGALRITDSEYLTNESHDNTFIASRLSGATACVRHPDNAPQPGCANASEWDGPTGFTSLNDNYTGDTCDVLLDISGASGIVIQSPIFNKGPNPSDFHTFCAENGTTSQGGGPVTNFHVIDPTFNAGTSATDTDFPQYNVGNQGDVSLYIDWTQTMGVEKVSGPAAVGAVVTWTDALSNNYTCTTVTGGTCSVPLTQYRDNNDTAANQVENRNPYSLSVTLSGCTTYTASGITISATAARPITLSGC